MGGSWFPKLFGDDPDNVPSSRLEELALEDIKKQLGITKAPVHVTTTIHRNTLPTYKYGLRRTYSSYTTTVLPRIPGHGLITGVIR